MSNERTEAGEGTSGGVEETNTAEIKSEPGPSANYDRSYAKYKFLLYAEIGAKGLQAENHVKRLQNLRKELNYIKDTEWRYEPVEKHIGQ